MFQLIALCLLGPWFYCRGERSGRAGRLSVAVGYLIYFVVSSVLVYGGLWALPAVLDLTIPTKAFIWCLGMAHMLAAVAAVWFEYRFLQNDDH